MHGWKGFLTGRGVSSENRDALGRNRCGVGIQTMPYRITVNEGEGIVCVNVSGQLQQSERIASFYESLRLCQSKGCFAILVNLTDLDVALCSAADAAALGQHIADKSPRIPTALVLPVDPTSKVDVTYTMLVAENRGGMIRQFDNVEAATKWLLDQGKAKTNTPRRHGSDAPHSAM